MPKNGYYTPFFLSVKAIFQTEPYINILKIHPLFLVCIEEGYKS